MTEKTTEENENFLKMLNNIKGMPVEWAFKRFTEYEEFFGVPREDILTKTEGKRGVNPPNHYQDAIYPPIGGFHVFETEDDLRKLIKEGFRCPACKGVSRDPYTCNTGINNCDWKSGGLFRGPFSFTFKSTFAEHCQIDVIFTPIALEKKEDIKEVEPEPKAVEEQLQMFGGK